ncbi:hypothetical protein GGH97_001806 [Coemansia sp. RSA 475]|nr:hypothetical protein GGH97_001806 [Coemansia sp. RSA 475]
MGRMGAGNFRPPPPGYNGMPYGGGGPRGPPTGPGSQYGYRGPQGVGMGSQRGAAAADQGNMMDTDTNDPDDARITAMLQQSSDQWMHQQSIMDMYVDHSNYTHIFALQWQEEAVKRSFHVLHF